MLDIINQRGMFYLQLNGMLTFRFVNQQQMHLYFSCHKETAKISVGAAVGAEKMPREDQVWIWNTLSVYTLGHFFALIMSW